MAAYLSDQYQLKFYNMFLNVFPHSFIVLISFPNSFHHSDASDFLSNVSAYRAASYFKNQKNLIHHYLFFACVRFFIPFSIVPSFYIFRLLRSFCHEWNTFDTSRVHFLFKNEFCMSSSFNWLIASFTKYCFILNSNERRL